METTVEYFDVACQDKTVTVIPLQELGQCDFAEIEERAAKFLEVIEKNEIKNVIIDLHKTNYVGTTALGWFVKLYKMVSKEGGSFALCCVSDQEREVIESMNLHSLWKMYDSREAALSEVAAT